MFDTRPNQPLGETKDHYWLVQRMARANGTDLVRAAEDGALSQEDWAAMVHRCRACKWAEGCKRWLSHPETELRETPEGCVNRHHFAALQDGMKE